MKMWGPIEVMLVGADLVLTFALLKATIVAGVFGALAWVVGRRSPALRSALWCAGFGVLVLAPLLRTRAPAWGTGLVQFPQRLWQQDVTAQVEAGAAAVAVGTLPWAMWLFVAWLLVAVLLLVRQVRDVRAALRLGREGADVDDARLRHCLGGACAVIGVRRRVALRISGDVAGPVSLGWRRPVIVLPPESLAWPTDRLEAVLCHEVAHIRRGDWPALLVAEAIRAFHWFNPMVPWMVARFRTAQDEACDAAALDAGFRPADYARHLVAVARSLRVAPRPGAVLPMATGRGLDRRVRALFEARRRAGRTRPLAVSLLGTLALAFGLSLGGMNLWVCPDGGQPATVAPADLADE